MATALATPFYIDMGYSLSEIGSVAKVAGLWASIAGGVLGGIIMLKVSINRALWLFGFVQLFTILPYIWLSQAGHTLAGLFVVVSGEYLGVGLGAIALTAFMARETSRAFTATQFALFTSSSRFRARWPMHRPASSSKPWAGRCSSSSASSSRFPACCCC